MLQVQKVASHLKKSLPLTVGLCAYVGGGALESGTS